MAIVINDWNRFQHYKDRWPPWIKTFTELLANDRYLGLSGHRRSILHGLWLAYAMSHGQLTHDTASLSRRLSLKVTTSDLEALNHAGFITITASTPIAKRSTDASPHALARGRVEAEDLTPEGSSVKASQAPASADARARTEPGDVPLNQPTNGHAADHLHVRAAITASLASAEQRQGQ